MTYQDRLNQIQETYTSQETHTTGRVLHITGKRYQEEGTVKNRDFFTGEEWEVPTHSYFLIEGYFQRVDPAAPELHFAVGIPEDWNGKVLQLGGGGFCGMVLPVWLGTSPKEESFLSKGWAVCTCDSGHQLQNMKSPWDGTWAINREALENFAYNQIILTKEAALLLLKEVHHREPSRVYYYGGSEGGREALEAVQRFPEEYDGALCFYPVLNWVMKAVRDSAFGNLMETLGTEAWLSPTDKALVRQTALAVCEGKTEDLPLILEKKEEIFQALGDKLTPKQMEALTFLCEPVEFPFPLANGWRRAPGYLCYMGCGLDSLYPSAPGKRDGDMMEFGDAVIKDKVMGDDSFQPSQFDPVRYKERFLAASKLLDATNPDLDRFYCRGGKLVVVHGLADEVVTPLSTLAYYHTLVERYGAKLDEFVKFYPVPRYGHGGGEFQVKYDFLSLLDQWVEQGSEPGELAVENLNANGLQKTQIVKPYQDTCLKQESPC